MIVIYLLLTLGTWIYMKQSKQASKTAFNYMNLMVTMLLGGLWHGASWAFVFWGFLHGMYLVVQRLAGPIWNRLLNAIRVPKFIQTGFAIAIVYFFTCLAWVYFRAPDFEIANQVISRIASFENFNFGSVINKFTVIKGVMVVGVLLFVELTDLRFKYSKVLQENVLFRVVSFAALLWLIAFFGTFDSNAFIYFQF